MSEKLDLSPLEVVIKGSVVPVAYACPTCGQLFVLGAGIDAEAQKRDAAWHCTNTCLCGKPIGYHFQIRCKECEADIAKKRERANFEIAEKISLEDYPDQPVYWEGHIGSMGDGFFRDIEEVLDFCEDGALEVPEYVWACTPHHFTMNGMQVLESELARQEAYEGAIAAISDTAKKNLHEFVKCWAKEQRLVSWSGDKTRAVLLRPAEETPLGKTG